MQINWAVVVELDDIVGPAHLTNLAIDSSEGVERMRNRDDGSTAALVHLYQTLPLCVESQVHLLGDHQRLVLWEVVKVGRVDEGEEDVIAALHAELISSWQDSRRLANGNNHLALGNILMQLQ